MWRKVHKTIAVVVGVFFLSWTTSGIVMTLPIGVSNPMAPSSTAPLDYRNIKMSPSEAIAHFEQAQGVPLEITGVSLTQIHGVPVYQISVGDSSKLVDTRSGQVFTINLELAQQIVRDIYSIRSQVFQAALLERHEPSYPWGSLPVYRIIFDDDHAVAYYVSPNDGTTQRSDDWSRLRNIISSIHTFDPILLVTSRDKVRQALLIFMSLVGIATALTGYYIAFERRWFKGA